MNGFVDMHCHILPYVDDGAESVEEMMAMLQMAYDDGIRHIITTPHYHPLRGKTDPSILWQHVKRLREEAHAIDPELRIYFGMEIFFTEDILEDLKQRKILTMNGRNYILVEFFPDDSYSKIRQGIQRLQLNKYHVILAHAERYYCLRHHLEFVKDLCKMGVKIQVNARSIIGKNGKKVKKFVKQILAYDYVFCVGTDAHNCNDRNPEMKKAALYVKKKYGEEKMKRIFFSNAAVMIRKEKK